MQAGASETSRSRRASSWPRWPVSACRRSAARAAASAPVSSARRWSTARDRAQERAAPSATSASRGDGSATAIQIFGSEPRAMGEAARMVEAAGADLVDINFGCPVRKVTKTGAGATLLDEPARAAAIVEAVASAVDVPVSVKMRRGLRDGSRTCLEVGPQLVDAGAATLTLHPRSAQQMYTGTADHALTAELVSLVERAGNRVGRHHLPRQGAGGARDDRRGRPSWSAAALRATRGSCARSSTATIASRRGKRSSRSSSSSSARRCASSAAARSGSSRRSTAGISAAAVSRGRSSRSWSCSTRPRRSSAC